MKKIFLIISSIFYWGLLPIIAQQIEEDDGPENREKRTEYELRNIMPPNGEPIPYKSFLEDNKNIDSYFKIKKAQAPNNAIPNINWNEQGPNNIGGRTRAIMFDPNTTNKVWAGGAAGGLWYNNDITNAVSSWQKVNDFWENLKITSIARSSANSQVFYVGTGERRPGGGANVYGGGIWKTTDGGSTWTQLPNTVPSVDTNFRYIQKIVVSGVGRVYAACFGGLLFSDDGGNTWSEIATNFTTNDANFENYFDDLEIAPFNIVYASYRNGNGGNSKILQVSATNVVTDVTPTYVGSGFRIELAIAPSTAGNTLTLYAICIGTVSTTTDVLWIKKSVNAGTNWSNITAPTYQRDGVGPFLSFTNNSGGNQGDYDLAMAVHPTNPNLVIVGGATNARTTNGGTSWVVDNYWASVHPDIHTVVFSPSNTNNVLLGNDGGIYLCSGYGDATNATPTFASRNKGYSVTEFYSVAIKNTNNDFFTLAGAQDNGTIKMEDYSFSDGLDVTGSDGALCFIDQDNPAIKIVSTQNLSHYLYNETAVAPTNPLTPLLVKSDGAGFINPCDYDSPNNIFYAYYKPRPAGGEFFYRVSNVGTTNDTTRFRLNVVGGVTMIKVGRAANTIFIGTAGARLYRANLSNIASPILTEITQLLNNTTPAGSNSYNGEVVYSIDIGADDNTLVLVKSNYNIKSVYYSTNGGTSWISKDEPTFGLPNIPIYGALFNPLNRSQVLLATELGVWSTMNIAAANPQWEPTDASLAHVRCLAFAYRSADNVVALATHGRGVYTTTLSSPCPANRNIVALPPGSAHYEASNTITSGIIMKPGTTSFDAGIKVRLTSGFKAKDGVHFKAYIDGCGGTR